MLLKPSGLSDLRLLWIVNFIIIIMVHISSIKIEFLNLTLCGFY